MTNEERHKLAQWIARRGFSGSDLLRAASEASGVTPLARAYSQAAETLQGIEESLRGPVTRNPSEAARKEQKHGND